MLMDQRIFGRELTVEATSAYILICSLAESGAPVTIESIATFWNGASEQLSAALEELSNQRIITESLDEKLMRHYVPNPPNLWKPSITETRAS